jgi:hypothetical protein
MPKREKHMRKSPQERPPRAKLSAEESLRRMLDIDKRKEAMIAAVRKNENRGLSA